MTESPVDEAISAGDGNGRQQRAGRKARSLEAAATAGVVYTVFSLVSMVLLSRLPDLTSSDSEMTAWFSDSSHQTPLILGLNLASISAIALLWFVAVIRRRLGDREDRFFGTVFFGSSIAFVVVWVTAAAMLAAPAVTMNVFEDGSISAASASLSAGLGASLLLIVAPRLQAVFILAVSNVIVRSGFLPRWLGLIGFATGVFMMLVPLVFTPLGVAFPVWVFVVSIVILLNRPSAPTEAGPGSLAGDL